MIKKTLARIRESVMNAMNRFFWTMFVKTTPGGLRYDISSVSHQQNYPDKNVVIRLYTTNGTISAACDIRGRKPKTKEQESLAFKAVFEHELRLVYDEKIHALEEDRRKLREKLSRLDTRPVQGGKE